MKLLAIAASLDPRDGWASYSLGLLRGLTALGVEARVLVERHADDEPPGLEVTPCLSSPLGGLVRPEAMAWNALQIVRRRGRAELLHFMVEPYATAWLPLLLPPTCITVHGTYAVSPFRERLPTRLLYAAALRRARAVFCVSRFTEQALLDQLALSTTVVVHNGHELSPEPPGAARDEVLVDGSPVIVGVGALKPRKGYHVALQAVARLRERFPDLRYYLVGDDADRKYVAGLRQDIAALGLERQAIITGPVSAGRLRAFYRRADLFLLTPVNVGQSFEGFGIAYLEANAYGKPVVGSLGNGAAEAIEEGVNGLLAPQNDPAAIADRAAAILADPALASRLGVAGRARAEAQTWSAVARRYLEVYERILHG